MSRGLAPLRRMLDCMVAQTRSCSHDAQTRSLHRLVGAASAQESVLKQAEDDVKLGQGSLHAPLGDAARGFPDHKRPRVYDVGSSCNIKWHMGSVSRDCKEKLLGQRGCVLWFTGLSGSGKSTVAYELERALHDMGRMCYVLDGDNVRHGLNANLGFQRGDRCENIRRIGEVSKLFAETGVITMVSLISPYRSDRDRVRASLGCGDFVEVFMKVPLEVCERRDPKGLYKRARRGQIKCFTGIDDPYEEPGDAEVILDAQSAPSEQVSKLVAYLAENGFLSHGARGG